MIQDNDYGWRRYKAEMKKAHGSHTKVGVHEGEKHEDPENQELSDLVIIAAAQEFGTKRIPSRSFLRTTYDENIQKINRLKTYLYGQISDGNISTEQALATLGEYFTKLVKEKITAIKTPPNALSTQRRKSRRKGIPMYNNPLIDTGQLIQSITHVEHV